MSSINRVLLACVAVVALTVGTITGGGVAPAAAATTTDVDALGIEYSFDPENVATVAMVTGYVGTNRDVLIPATVTFADDEYTVNAIGEEAFLGKGLTSATIPEFVTTIGTNAFGDNGSLASITMQGPAPTLGTAAFGPATDRTIYFLPKYADGYESPWNGYTTAPSVLTVSFDANGQGVTPDPVTVNRGEAAAEPTAPTATNFVFDGWFTEATGGAEWDFTTTVTADRTLFARWVSTIKTETFEQVEYTVNTADAIPFATATDYEGSGGHVDIRASIDIDGVTYPVTTIGELAFLNGGSEEDCEFGTYDNALTSVTLPASLTTIGDYAFCFNRLTSLMLPASLTSIGFLAFHNNDLKSVVFPDSVTTIDDAAFWKNALTSVVLPASLTSINYIAFAENELTSVVIPDSVTTIDQQSFAFNRLKSVVIPDSVRFIGFAAFDSNELTSLVLSDSLTSVGDSAFSRNLLTSVVFPDSLTSVSQNAFSDNRLTSIVLPDSVTSIGGGAFSRNLLTSVIFPDSVTDIGSSAFSSNALTSVVLSSSLRYIGGEAFAHNDLATLVIPQSVISISADAFSENPRLSSVVMQGPKPQYVQSNVFGDPKNVRVYYDPDRSAEYQNGFYSYTTTRMVTLTFDPNGQGLAPTTVLVVPDIAAIEPSKPTATEFLFDGWFTAANGGSAWDFRDPVAPNSTLFGRWVTSIRTPTIDGIRYTVNLADAIPQVTATGYVGLGGHVEIPSTIAIDGASYPVTTIGAGSFVGKGVTSLTIGDAVSSIGSRAFEDNMLTSLRVGISITSIGEHAFSENQLAVVVMEGRAPTASISAFGDPTELIIYYFSAHSGDYEGGWYSYTTAPLPTLTYDANGQGVAPAPKSVIPGVAVAEPAEPVAANFIFTGWFTAPNGGVAWIFGDPVTEDTTLFARWVSIVSALTISDTDASAATEANLADAASLASLAGGTEAEIGDLGEEETAPDVRSFADDTTGIAAEPAAAFNPTGILVGVGVLGALGAGFLLIRRRMLLIALV